MTALLEGTRILAVHHDASLSGAALLFQSVLEGLAENHGAAISLRFPGEGPLVARARDIGPTEVGESQSGGPAGGFVARAARRLRSPARQERSRRYDLIFANSVASLAFVERMLMQEAVPETMPLVVYVHESRFLLQKDHFPATTRMLRRARLIFAVSSSVRGTLEEMIQPSARISVVSGFLLGRPGTGQVDDLPPAVRDAVRSGARIVGGLGTITWYKGTDLFVALARRIRQLLPQQQLKFVWMGQEQYPDACRLLEHDIERAGLSEDVILAGPTNDPRAFFESLSLFLLPSREDSWPLVMLEAAAAGVPIVCFQRSGGAEEFIASGGGTAVPYLDVEAMAQAAVRYLSQPDLMERDSRIARQRAQAVTGEEQIKRIASGLAQVLNSSAPGAARP